jgi:hypothetical protein
MTFLFEKYWIRRMLKKGQPLSTFLHSLYIRKTFRMWYSRRTLKFVWCPFVCQLLGVPVLEYSQKM